MSDIKPSGPAAFPGIAILFVALGVFMVTDTPLKPTRPNVPVTKVDNSEEVIARLWQDPFEAVALHKKNNGNAKHQEDNISTTPVNSIHSIDKLKNYISSRTNTNYNYKAHIIAVMVTGGQYAEDRENRIRSRYAVVSGLLNNKYVPIDSNHIGYVNTDELCKASARNTENCHFPEHIPFEWYTSPGGEAGKWNNYRYSKNILVLWLDDNAISRNKPLKKLSLLRKSLDQETTHDESVKHNIKFDVIGPANSTSLISFYKNSFEYNLSDDNSIINNYGNKKDQIRIFSHRATLNQEAINESLKDYSKAETSPPDTKAPKIHEKITDFTARINRTIATDDKLVDHLLCEMLRRGINPYHDKKHLTSKAQQISNKNLNCTNFNISSLNRNNKKDYIALIGEGDTEYTRNFRNLFKNKIYSVTREHTKKVDWLYSFSYLRGLDGEIIKKSSTSKSDTSKDKSTEFRRAAGANQFDYLRRLSTQLKNLQAQNYAEGSLRAIGIVGSDTYDKLLILQALRNHFPDVLFFTTDLDARMLHDSENTWVRNLVVASAHNLVPENNGYTFNNLAFRDSYQTALYNTTLFAQATPKGIIDFYKYSAIINDKDSCTTHINDRTITPKDIPDIVSDSLNITHLFNSPVKIFEIGNSKPVDYSHKKLCSEEIAKIDDTNKRTHSVYLIIGIGLLTLLLLQSNNYARVYILSLAFIALNVFIWSSFYTSDNNKEFQAMFTGTSVWPAYIIRMVASSLSLIIIGYALIKLKVNTINIINTFKFARIHSSQKTTDNDKPGFKDSIRLIYNDTKSNTFQKTKSILSKVYIWLFRYEFYSKNIIQENKLIPPSRWSRFLVTAWGAKDIKNSTMDIDNLFYQYILIGTPKCRLKRVFTLSFLYLALSFIFIHTFSSMPVVPFTGYSNALAAKHTIFALLIPYIFLVFLVSDVSRLNSRFVQLLFKYKITWPKQTLNSCCEKFGLIDDVSSEKLKINLIVQRSLAVDKLIFLPFIILTLMILSKSTYFDRWHTPPQLALVILLGAVIALTSAIRLRISARDARIKVLENLNEIYKEHQYLEESADTNNERDSSNCSKNMSKRVQILIDEIQNISKGPFLPLSQHPILTAVAMPFGGIGGLYLLDYMGTIGL